jgi:FkbM family methyltransferase
MSAADTLVPMKQFRCPNGLRIWNSPRSGDETVFIFREIFEGRCYEQHGVTIKDGDYIVDLGANVGLFALSAMERFNDLKLLCVEPVPSTRACLERNLEESSWRSQHAITVLSYAIGSANGEATIAYFPQAPGNSTLHLAEKRREWNRIADDITSAQLRKLNKVFGWLPRRIVTWFMRPMLNEAVTFKCNVCTLSDIILQQGLERIDLLKIDVEGAELDALQGIEDRHWSLIQQLVMEVAPANKGSITALVSRLRAVGFREVIVQSFDGGEVDLLDPMPCTLYAVRAPR